jgi:predicted nucleic acid-binding protein
VISYLDACALLKFIKPEAESAALRKWREDLSPETELLTSELAKLEISRTLLRAGVDPHQVPYFTAQALRGVYVVDLSSTVLARAMAYRTTRLGSLDAIHLASAEPFRADLEQFVTYDKELTGAAAELGFPTLSPA